MKAPGVGSKFDFCRSVKLQAWVEGWDKRWALTLVTMLVTQIVLFLMEHLFFLLLTLTHN